MTEQPNPSDADAAVAGLARELEGLRRRLDRLAELSPRVAQLAGAVAWLAKQAADQAERPSPAAPNSWLDHPADVPTAQHALGELTAWMGRVYLRYPDGAAHLPDCWLWHPDVVEELLWLMLAWLTAYTGDTASVQQAGDWHDRYRPGVVRRVKGIAGMCSLENHLRGDAQQTRAPVVPAVAAVAGIATWWGSARDHSAPQPSEEQLAEAATRWRPGGGRR